MSTQEQRIADAGLVLMAVKHGLLTLHSSVDRQGIWGNGALQLRANLDENGLPILLNEERDALREALVTYYLPIPTDAQRDALKAALGITDEKERSHENEKTNKR